MLPWFDITIVPFPMGGKQVITYTWMMRGLNETFIRLLYDVQMLYMLHSFRLGSMALGT